MNAEELQRWTAHMNKRRELIEQHVAADRDEDEPRREAIAAQLEALGCNVEWTSAGWLISH